MPKPIGPEGRKVTLGAKVRRSVRTRFEESAKRNGSNRSALAEILVEGWLESEDVKTAVRSFMDKRETGSPPDAPPASRRAAPPGGRVKAANR